MAEQCRCTTHGAAALPVLIFFRVQAGAGFAAFQVQVAALLGFGGHVACGAKAGPGGYFFRAGSRQLLPARSSATRDPARRSLPPRGPTERHPQWRSRYRRPPPLPVRRYNPCRCGCASPPQGGVIHQRIPAERLADFTVPASVRQVPCCADEAAELPVPPEALPDCPAPCCKDDDADPAADGAGDGCAVATGTSCAGWFTAASGESHTSVPSSRACFWMRVRSSTPRTTLRMAAIPVMVAANTSARQTRYSPFAFKNALMLFIFPRPLLAVRPKHRAQNLPPGIFNRTVRVVYAISVARTDWFMHKAGKNTGNTA